MAICAGVPSTGTVSVSFGDGKPRMRKEDRRLPRQCAMTRCAGRREPCREVIWMLSIRIIPLMTRNAVNGCSPKTIVDVACVARHPFVCAACLKLRSVMIETGLPRRSTRSMTLFTIRTESRRSMVDRHRTIVVPKMTGNTSVRCPRELQVDVTTSAGDTPVLANKPERCPRVIEFHRIGQLRPAFGRVAVCAGAGEVSVG